MARFEGANRILLFLFSSHAPPVSSQEASTIRSRPIRDFDVEEAYTAALDRDTLQGYEEFLAAYPDAPMARRVHAIVSPPGARRSLGGEPGSLIPLPPIGPICGDIRPARMHPTRADG